MRFLVTGATGFIGSHMAELLLAHGSEVVCPVRCRSALRHLAGVDVELLAVNEIERQIPHGPPIDCVIHIAGATRAVDYGSYRAANVDYTRRLLELFTAPRLKAGLKRFVLVSSQAAAGPSPDDGTPIKESDAPHPISLYGRSKLEAEELTARFKGEIPITVIRPSTVFGPRDADVLGVFRCARYRLAPFLAGPDRLVSIIYVQDLVEGILKAALSPLSLGKTYFVANPKPVVWRAFVMEAARILGYRAIALPIPVPAIKVLAVAGDLICRLTGSPPLVRSEKLEEMKQIAWVCSTEQAREDLDWVPRTPLNEALKKTAAWYRAHGWI